jgi:hypothetical protein
MPAYCSSCGASTYGTSAAFCTKCGSQLRQVPAPQQPTAPIRYAPAQPATPFHVVVRLPKSVGVALVLSFLFGPLGLLYATIKGGLIMLVVEFLGGLLIFSAIVRAGRLPDPAAGAHAVVGGLVLLYLFACLVQAICVI